MAEHTTHWMGPSQGKKHVFFTIFNCTDLKKDVSEAKFDAKSDFEVHLAVVPETNRENIIFGLKIRPTKISFGIEQ